MKIKREINRIKLEKLLPGFQFGVKNNVAWFQNSKKEAIPENVYYKETLPKLKELFGKKDVIESFTEEVGRDFRIILRSNIKLSLSN
jgi:hypothetical protein